ncbi:MAG TPA: AAA family ATPase [Stellaceae bacterium]|nr:AAA family ATPase [Stellaceae bacterium]
MPLEMARQKISSPAEWDGVHQRLKNFGQRSGLFEDIDIRLLGKRDGDPFQVTVRGNGPPFNLVDVGYGVSQALPIIYQLEQSRQHDTFLLQQPEVHLHPRAQAELGSVIARLSKQRSASLFMVETHSDYIIDSENGNCSGEAGPSQCHHHFF